MFSASNLAQKSEFKIADSSSLLIDNVLSQQLSTIHIT
jgi:hypothetical protein